MLFVEASLHGGAASTEEIDLLEKEIKEIEGVCSGMRFGLIHLN